MVQGSWYLLLLLLEPNSGNLFASFLHKSQLLVRKGDRNMAGEEGGAEGAVASLGHVSASYESPL